MTPAPSKIAVVGIAAALAFAFHVSIEGVDVKVEHSKTFDFKPVKTWAWNPKEAGRVIMSRTQEDDPEGMKRRVEPVIMDAVTKETTARGLKQAESQPDLTLTYYLLLSTGTSAQTIGQFLPATSAWGLPSVSTSHPVPGDDEPRIARARSERRRDRRVARRGASEDRVRRGRQEAPGSPP